MEAYGFKENKSPIEVIPRNNIVVWEISGMGYASKEYPEGWNKNNTIVVSVMVKSDTDEWTNYEPDDVMDLKIPCMVIMNEDKIGFGRLIRTRKYKVVLAKLEIDA